MDLVFSIDLLVFNAAQYTAGADVVGIMTELGLRLTNVQYNGRSYGSWCNTFYNRNTVSLYTFCIEINRDLKKNDKIHNPFYISIHLFSFNHREFIAYYYNHSAQLKLGQ